MLVSPKKSCCVSATYKGLAGFQEVYHDIIKAIEQQKQVERFLLVKKNDKKQGVWDFAFWNEKEWRIES